MSEADLIEEWMGTLGPLWTMFQFWGGVSFGLIALAHLAAEKLNRTLLVSVISLYTVFSAWMAYSLDQIESLRRHIASDLQQVTTENGSISNTGMRIVEYMAEPIALYSVLPALAILGTFGGCIAYLIYAYRHRNRDDSEPIDT